jgi:ketosteroid isomerase-like protein
MSAENVELARKLLGSFADRGVEGVLPFFDPAVEWTTAEDEPDQQTYQGLDGIRRLYAQWSELWESGFETDVEPEEFRAAEDCVIVPVRVQVRGRSSGVEVEIQETYVFTFAAGKIVRVREFRKKTEAFTALGLAE